MRARLWAVGLTVGMLLVGCGGSDSGDDEGGGEVPASVTLEQAAAKVVQATCSKLTECWGPLWSLMQEGADCRTTYAPVLLEGWFAIAARGVGDGTVTFDGSRIDACLDSLRDASCSAVYGSRYWDTCGELFVGQVPENGACEEDMQCAGAARCDFSYSCPGVCVALSGPGEWCAEAADCLEGACLGGVCGPHRVNDAPCLWDEECASGHCDGAACAAEPVAGSPCLPAEDEVCGQFMMCVDLEGTGGSTCQPIPAVFSRDLGESCGAVYCKEGLSCSITAYDPATQAYLGTCIAPDSQANGPCAYAFPDTCPQGYACFQRQDEPSGTCRALPVDGQPCANGSCAAEHRCVSGTCRGMKRMGESCIADDLCYSKACSGGTCVTWSCEAALY